MLVSATAGFGGASQMSSWPQSQCQRPQIEDDWNKKTSESVFALRKHGEESDSSDNSDSERDDSSTSTSAARRVTFGRVNDDAEYQGSHS